MKGSLRSGIITAGAIVVVALGGLLAPGWLAAPTHTMAVRFPTADGLLGGSDVLEAGARVGSVADIVPESGGTALVTLSIDDDHWPLHTGLHAAVRPKSLLGEKYIALTDGATAAAPYDASRTLVETQKAVPVELDQFVNSLDPETRTAAQTLLDDLGAGVAGRGQDINAALASGRADLDHLAVTGKTLNGRDADLDRILISLDALLQKMTADEQLTQLQQLIGNGRQTLDAIEAERQSFQHSLVDADAALADLNASFDSAVPSLRQSLDVAPHLVAQLGAESTVLAQLAGGVNNNSVLPALIQGVQHGPTATGGALEKYPDGRQLPIFRICLVQPSPGSCTGSGGFTPAGPQPAASSADSSSDMAMFASWMAS